jgi:hypothetical protein
METNNKKITIGCVSPLTVIIFLAFFFAKIFDKIDWSWWWVFSPLWIPLAFVLGLITIAAIIYLLMTLFALYDLWKTK